MAKKQDEPDFVSMAAKKAAELQSAKAPVAAKKEDSIFDQEAIAQIILAAAPTLVGAALGGTKGAAIGAEAGKVGLSTFGDIKKEQKKEEKEAAAGRAKARETSLKEIETFTKLGAEQRKAGKEVTNEQIKKTDDLAKRWEKDKTTLNTGTVAESWNRIQEAGREPSAAGDLALIFSYMKILDPGSTVREGEFANAQNAGGVPDKIRALANQISSGQRLSQSQREDFLDRSQRLYEAQLNSQQRVDKHFTELSKKRGVNPADVVLPFGGSQPGGGRAQPSVPVGPSAGTGPQQRPSGLVSMGRELVGGGRAVAGTGRESLLMEKREIERQLAERRKKKAVDMGLVERSR